MAIAGFYHPYPSVSVGNLPRLCGELAGRLPNVNDYTYANVSPSLLSPLVSPYIIRRKSPTVIGSDPLGISGVVAAFYDDFLTSGNDVYPASLGNHPINEAIYYVPLVATDDTLGLLPYPRLIADNVIVNEAVAPGEYPVAPGIFFPSASVGSALRDAVTGLPYGVIYCIHWGWEIYTYRPYTGEENRVRSLNWDLLETMTSYDHEFVHEAERLEQGADPSGRSCNIALLHGVGLVGGLGHDGLPAQGFPVCGSQACYGGITVRRRPLELLYQLDHRQIVNTREPAEGGAYWVHRFTYVSDIGRRADGAWAWYRYNQVDEISRRVVPWSDYVHVYIINRLRVWGFLLGQYRVGLPYPVESAPVGVPSVPAIVSPVAAVLSGLSGVVSPAGVIGVRLGASFNGHISS